MINPELAAHLESGCALIVGTVAADGEPHATRGWGLTVLPDERVRLLLDGRDELVLNDLVRDGRGPGGAVAVTGADVRTLRAVQLKGQALSLEPATPVDVERAARFCDEFITDVSTNDGTPRALLERLVPGQYVACVVAVERLFDQTPGPRAGVPLSVDAS